MITASTRTLTASWITRRLTGGISSTARFVAFSTLSTTLVRGDTNGQQDVFVLQDKVIDHIFAEAKVEERQVTKDELQAAVEALDEE